MTIDTILNLYNEGVRNIILYGPPGTGKTYTITGPNMLLSKLAKETITATTEHVFEDILPLRYDYMNRKQSEVIETDTMPKPTTTSEWRTYGKKTDGLKGSMKKEILEAHWEENQVVTCCQDSDESFHSKFGEPWEFSKWKDSEDKVFEWQSKIHYEILQFHASYDYSDFMMGVAFDKKGSLTNEFKILYRFAMCATLNPGRLHVLHIDEINRGNVARIFGEALMAMEKRNFPVTLRDGTWFTMPKNLLILGTMNSADHHIQPMDQALRRRFCFVPLLPMGAISADWISPGILVDNSPAKQLYSRVLEVFKRPGEESIWDTNRNGLDLREFAIGPSFFKLDEGVEDTWQNVKDQNWTKKVKNQLSEYEKEGIVSSDTVGGIETWLSDKIKAMASDD